ncbi:hypothetical protein CRG98_021818 [Punica granatum]|uniref:Uncharacterized protein n=1 Tax=Punica granatum TaxID=22663 RepID=A0A2I0JND0_PUNGR|nr:hypothetical protein CRG98_021818 [Punica granatum]
MSRVHGCKEFQFSLPKSLLLRFRDSENPFTVLCLRPFAKISIFWLKKSKLSLRPHEISGLSSSQIASTSLTHRERFQKSRFGLIEEKLMAGRVALGQRILQDENMNVKAKSTIPLLDLITPFYLYELEVRVLPDSKRQKKRCFVILYLGSRSLIVDDDNVLLLTICSSCVETAVGVGGQSRSLKTAPKNGGVRLGSRRALNDITNKSSSSSNELLPKKKDARKEESIVAEQREFNAAEERFLHDHNSESKMDHSNSEQAKAQVDIDSPRCYPEPVELPMSEFSYWNYDPTQWDSPPCSPIHSVSPFIWQFDEEVEFVLKQENDV